MGLVIPFPESRRPTQIDIAWELAKQRYDKTQLEFDHSTSGIISNLTEAEWEKLRKQAHAYSVLKEIQAGE